MTQNETEAPKNWQAKFFTIWTGQAFSLLGSTIAQFALIWWLTDRTESATVLAWATLVGLLPMIFISPLTGALVDRWNRRIIMIVADSGIALCSLILAYLYWKDLVQVWHIYVFLFLRAVGGGFHFPAMMASTSLMVPDKHLTRVAGINQILNGMLSIFGPPLGALAWQFLSMANIMLLIDVGTAVLAVAPLFFVTIPQPPRQAAEPGAAEPRPSLWKEMADGFRYLLNWKGMLILIGLALVFKVASTPAFSLFPLLVKKYFQGGAFHLSLVETMMGVGVVCGGLILGAWGGFKNRLHTMLLPLIISGLCMTAIGFIPANAFWVMVVMTFLIGLLMPPIDGTFMAIMQGNVAPEVQGRVFSLVGALLNLTSPIGLLFAGPISDKLGLQPWYIAGGLLTAAATFSMLLIPAVMNLERDRKPPSKPVDANPET
jgi:DHA3 family macrolide efflux protein-like MFS transporter